METYWIKAYCEIVKTAWNQKKMSPGCFDFQGNCSIIKYLGKKGLSKKNKCEELKNVSVFVGYGVDVGDLHP